MKVYVKNKLISLGGSSNVFDEHKNPIFKVKGKIFTFTRVKWICDMSGNKLYKVRNRLINFFVHKTYIYDASGQKIASVRDKFFNIKKEYFVEGMKDDIRTDGKFFSLSCCIYRNNEVIGVIRRQITFFTDCFELEADEKDIPFLIALVISIDNIIDDKTNQRD